MTVAFLDDDHLNGAFAPLSIDILFRLKVEIDDVPLDGAADVRYDTVSITGNVEQRADREDAQVRRDRRDDAAPRSDSRIGDAVQGMPRMLAG